MILADSQLQNFYSSLPFRMRWLYIAVMVGTSLALPAFEGMTQEFTWN
jgi:uncharacterized membrane protein YqhA